MSSNNSRPDRPDRSTKSVVNPNGQRVTPKTGLPASNQRAEAPNCTSCRSSNTFIYATRQFIRYCKCRHCGHTYSFSRPSTVRATTIIDIQTR